MPSNWQGMVTRVPPLSSRFTISLRLPMRYRRGEKGTKERKGQIALSQSYLIR